MNQISRTIEDDRLVSIMSNNRFPTTSSPTRIELTTAEQVRAISDPLRTTILGLLHERAATVTELATAVKRPKSTVAHHVNVLAEAGMLQVVRTRRVRAIDERYYGRTARMFYVGRRPSSGRRPATAGLQRLRGRGQGVRRGLQAGQMDAFIRHARIPTGAGGRVLAPDRGPRCRSST